MSNIFAYNNFKSTEKKITFNAEIKVFKKIIIIPSLITHLTAHICTVNVEYFVNF